MQRRTAIKHTGQYGSFLVLFLFLAAAGTLLFFADDLTRSPLEMRNKKDSLTAMASRELGQELDNALNRIAYVRKKEEAEINEKLKNRADTAKKFIIRMTETRGKAQGLKTAVDVLSAQNRQYGRYRLYVLSLDGKAYIFPADRQYEGLSFYGFGADKGKNIFTDITEDTSKYEGRFISYSLDSQAGGTQRRKLAYFTSDSRTNIAVIAEADHAEAEKLVKKKVLDDLSKLYMLYPAYGRINIFESEAASGGKLKTLLSEELENTPENDSEKSTEFSPLINGKTDSFLHIRRDPVFGKYFEVITRTAKYPEWNWHLTKSHFFEYENIYGNVVSQVRTYAGQDIFGGYFMAAVYAVMVFFTVFILTRNRVLAVSALRPAEEKLGRLREMNFRLIEKIKEHTEKENRLNDVKLELEEKLALKTKEYKKMNEMLIAENMERTQQDQILRAEKEKAEAANIMKREFLTNTSEKLNTMVTDLKTFSETGSESFESMTAEEINGLFGKIHAKGGELMSFLGLIIDLSKLEAGKTEDKISPLDFRELFARLSYETMPLFSATESSLSAEFSAENIRIFTRCRHAELAFLHLLTHAAKNCGKNSMLFLRCFPTKSLRSGVLVNSATVEIGHLTGFNELKEHSTFSLPSGSDSASINISIFNEALKRCGGTFFTTETDKGSLFSVVIPDLSEQQ
ncbi:hypothetical protein EP073_10940 [Geovibrio thiophilus]|uniref:Double Cache domain-containing protein n=1 Tax=Geovibrio thiophilus TaxID=139438 RepID=A0A410K0I2_9BACT|nr:cache domain-containing protein [Geovibrio thiophilus]QAR33899.1 hypothetical protein EP073_10940 [Geovibrio thiophilus]